MRRRRLFLAAGAAAFVLAAFTGSAGAQDDDGIPAYALPSAAALGPWPWNFDIGGGPAWVAGPARRELTSGSNFTFGAGYNFTPRTGFVVEFTSLYFGLQDSVIQQNNALDGDAGIWGVTLSPVWRYRIAGIMGGYLIGGGGYYERDIRLDEPTQITFPTSGGSTSVPAVKEVNQYADGAGVNIGTGLTWNVAAGAKLFVEVRYHYIFLPGKPTQVIPLTFGLRW